MLLPRLVADKISFYLYHFNHVELMREMRKKIFCFNNCVAVEYKYGCGWKFYVYRNIELNSSMYRPIYNVTKTNVAKLPKNYWYSNGDF